MTKRLQARWPRTAFEGDISYTEASRISIFTAKARAVLNQIICSIDAQSAKKSVCISSVNTIRSVSYESVDRFYGFRVLGIVGV